MRDAIRGGDYKENKIKHSYLVLPHKNFHFHVTRPADQPGTITTPPTQPHFLPRFFFVAIAAIPIHFPAFF
jgi:hypothetical protein